MKLDLAIRLEIQKPIHWIVYSHYPFVIRMLLTSALLVQEFGGWTFVALDFNAVVFHQKCTFSGPLLGPGLLENLTLDSSAFFNKLFPPFDRVFW